MSLFLREPRSMSEPRGRGRPRKGLVMTSIKIDEESRDIARRAATIRGESITVYVSRTLREVGRAEILEEARQQVALAEAEAAAKAAKKGKGAGDA